MSNEQCGDAPTCSCKPKPLNGQHWTGCPEGKVEELSEQIVRAVYGSGIDCVYVEHIEFAKLAVAAILRPYFSPASQTDDKRVENTFDKLAYEGFFEDVQDWSPLSRDECMKILRELATPASTARTDALLEICKQIEQIPYEHRTAMEEHIGNLARTVLDAAPGSVPQAEPPNPNETSFPANVQAEPPK